MFGLEEKTFGVEIEFVGAQLSALEIHMQTELQGTGIAVHREGYNHNVRNHWKIVSDASVSRHIDYSRNDAIGGEVVSPILRGQAGLDELEKVLDAMNSHPDVSVNVTCGLHLHISWDNMTTQQIKNIVRRYALFEDNFDSMMPNSRRNSRWCANISRNSSLLRSVEGHRGSVRDMANCGGGDRYRKVNLTPLARYGTIEFRQHSGTTDFDKVSNWVKLMSDFCDASQQAATSGAPVNKEYRRQGQQRPYAELRELLEAQGFDLHCEHHVSRPRPLFNSNGEVVGSFTNDELLALYEVGAINPNTGTRTRQRGNTFTEEFVTWFGNLTGNTTDSFLRGVNAETVDYVQGRIETFNPTAMAA